MSFKHIILPVDKSLNDYAYEVCDIFRERGQYCVVDDDDVGINKKIDNCDNQNFDYILIINRTSKEINYANVRETKSQKLLGNMHITDFLHNLFCDKL